jgi:uncharacterized Zn-binding protein involved in type VI secretion
MAGIDRYFICLGDGTGHGGKVISAWGKDSFATEKTKWEIQDVPVACIGDKVYCPECRGTHTILQGDNVPHRPKHCGRVIASTADIASCGARLFASQSLSSYRDESWVAPALAAGLARQKGAATQAAYGSGSGGFQKVGLFGASVPRMSDKVFEANMCEWACDCKDKYGKNGTHQGCVDEKIKSNPQYYDSNGHPKDNSPVWSEVSFYKNDDSPYNNPPSYRKYDLLESENYPGKPTSWYPRSDTWRIDVVKIGANGKPEKFYDMKFPPDDPTFSKDTGRKKAYEAIAKKHTGSGGNFEVFDVADRCACGKEQEKGKEQTQTEQKSFTDKIKDIFRKPEPPIDFPPGGNKPPTAPPAIPLPGIPPILI